MTASSLFCPQRPKTSKTTAAMAEAIATAATTSLSVKPSNLHSQLFLSSTSFPIFRLNSLKNPNFRPLVVSSTSIESAATQKPSSKTSFLDQREGSRYLHFVKYHGLGNDFILVIPFSIT